VIANLTPPPGKILERLRDLCSILLRRDCVI
jgi:hypothetical protein